MKHFIVLESTRHRTAEGRWLWWKTQRPRVLQPARLKLHLGAKNPTQQQMQRGAGKTSQKSGKRTLDSLTRGVWCCFYAVADCSEWATGVLMGWERAGVVWTVKKHRVQGELGQILTLCSSVWREGRSLTCLSCSCCQATWGPKRDKCGFEVETSCFQWR